MSPPDLPQTRRINSDDEDLQPLETEAYREFHNVIENGGLKEFVALIEKHPRSVHVYGFRGMALLPYVAGEGRIDLTEHLLSIGIDINKDGPLEAALDNCQLEVVKLLLEKGADPNLDRTLISAINADEHSFEFVKLLVEHGADIHRCFTFGPPGTPLVNALSWSIVKGEEEIEEYLRSLGAEMPEGVTPGPDKPWWKFW